MKSGNFSVEFVNANEISVVSNISNALAKGQSTQVSIYKSLDDNMNKGRGANKNPYIGRVYKREIYGGWELQGKPSWHTYFNDFFETDRATRTKFYLQLQRSEKQGSRVETTYYLDGKELPKDSQEFEDVAKWFKAKPTPKQSSSQIASGISAENERHYILITLANIERIKQGEREITLAVNKEREATTTSK